MPSYRDFSEAHHAVADGLWFDDSVPLINHDNVIIWKGIIFKTMEVMEIWLAEYACSIIIHLWLNIWMRISTMSSHVVVVVLG
jgi:hypothetical protein